MERGLWQKVLRSRRSIFNQYRLPILNIRPIKEWVENKKQRASGRQTIVLGVNIVE